MKILMVNKFLYPRGGAETYMLKLGECFLEGGHEVQYFGMYDEKNTVGNESLAYTDNVDFHSKSVGRFLYPFKIIYSHKARRAISKVLDEFKPDIVHMNNINFQITPSILYEINKRNIPVVQTVHDYQMICPNHLLYSFSEGMPCTRCIGGSKLNCIKYKCIHGSLAKSIIGAAEAYFYKILNTYKLTDMYVCPSRFLEKKLLESSKIFNGKTFTIHNFISKREKIDTDLEPKPYIVFAGRFSREKGIELLAETAKLLPEYKFKVAGSGPDENYFSGVPNIESEGFLTGEAYSQLVKNAKALILPSICFENCPLSILEAHSMGVPVITMNSGGMAELVEDNVTGVLAENPNAESLCAAVKRLLSSEESYNTVRENCRRRAESIITAREYSDIITNKYNELIERRQKNARA